MTSIPNLVRKHNLALTNTRAQNTMLNSVGVSGGKFYSQEGFGSRNEPEALDDLSGGGMKTELDRYIGGNKKKKKKGPKFSDVALGSSAALGATAAVPGLDVFTVPAAALTGLVGGIAKMFGAGTPEHKAATLGADYMQELMKIDPEVDSIMKGGAAGAFLDGMKYGGGASSGGGAYTGGADRDPDPDFNTPPRRPQPQNLPAQPVPPPPQPQPEPIQLGQFDTPEAQQQAQRQPENIQRGMFQPPPPPAQRHLDFEGEGKSKKSKSKSKVKSKATKAKSTSGKRVARGQLIKKIMKERGVSLSEASKIIKNENMKY